jgi:hypothetical protein
MIHSNGYPVRINSGDMCLVAPQGLAVPSSFTNRAIDAAQHRDVLHSVQRFRGSLYAQDGALPRAHLTADGRHEQEADYRSWHLVTFDSNGRICGCARFHAHHRDLQFEDLTLSAAGVSRSALWGAWVKRAVEARIDACRRSGLVFAEVGGWAIEPLRRGTRDCLRIALSTYALAEILGGSFGLGTATVRHHSSTILRKIGGRVLDLDGVELPAYYDPQYRCEMEMLWFDSSRPTLRFAPIVKEIQAQLARVEVLGNAVAEPANAPREVPALWQPEYASAAPPAAAHRAI